MGQFVSAVVAALVSVWSIGLTQDLARNLLAFLLVLIRAAELAGH